MNVPRRRTFVGSPGARTVAIVAPTDVRIDRGATLLAFGKDVRVGPHLRTTNPVDSIDR